VVSDGAAPYYIGIPMANWQRRAVFDSKAQCERLLTKSAAVQCAPDKIRVNSIHPGLILMPMPGVVTPEELQPLVEATPLKRGAEPEEVGWCAVFLASDEASFVTGSELVVDGGYTAQ